MVSKAEFKKEVERLAAEINVKPKQIRMREMRSKLGSCSKGKVLTFAMSALNLEGKERRQLILHELLHLRYKNHGKMFKTLLKTYFEVK
jgi:predicted metal-dependent hydrolase